jgi:hypothetical protein
MRAPWLPPTTAAGSGRLRAARIGLAGEGGERRAHRIADDFVRVPRSARARTWRRRWRAGPHAPRQQAVGAAEHGVLLVDERGRAPQRVAAASVGKEA